MRVRTIKKFMENFKKHVEIARDARANKKEIVDRIKRGQCPFLFVSKVKMGDSYWDNANFYEYWSFGDSELQDMLDVVTKTKWRQSATRSSKDTRQRKKI